MDKIKTTDSSSPEQVRAYDDNLHAEDLSGLSTGDFGYKYRKLGQLLVPPYVTPERYQTSRSIDLREDDICYGSYPKSGSTWLAHIILLIIHKGIPPNEGTLRSHLNWVESSWTYPRSKQELHALPSPRIFKSHMPANMALGGDPASSRGKYIYIARNPKDVAVSYYHFESDKAWSGHYDGPWEHWLKIFLAGNVQRGSWFEHVLSWWNMRKSDNVLFLKYEDLVDNFSDELNRICAFLDYQLSSDVIAKIEHLTTFDTMRKTKFSNMHEIEDFEGFFRKGKIGSWQEQFTDKQDQLFSQEIKNRLATSDLTFDYE